MTSRAQEYNVIPALQEQFGGLHKSYLENLKNFIDKSKNISNIISPVHMLALQNDEHGNPFFFRANINIPSLFILSFPISRCFRYKKYPVPINEERRYYADLALIPAYCVSLNIFTCINFWGPRAADFRSPHARPLEGEEERFMRLDTQSTGPCQLSSLNFFLVGRGKENEIPPIIRTVLSNYLKYAFWSFPKKGFGSSAHIIHAKESDSRQRIYRIIKIAKSIYLVKKIFNSETIRLPPHYKTLVEVRRAELIGLGREGYLNNFKAYIASDVAQKLEEKIGSTDQHGILINGMVYELRERDNSKLRLLSVVNDFLPDSPDLFTTLTGFVATEQFQSKPLALTYIGETEELRRKIEVLYRSICKDLKIRYGTTIFDLAGRPIEQTIDELFPILLRDGTKVFFVHPVIISILMQLGLENIIEKKDILVKFLRLLEQAPKGDIALISTAEWNYFKKDISYGELKSALVSICRYIHLSKILRECF